MCVVSDELGTSGTGNPHFMSTLCTTQQVNIILHTFLSLQGRAPLLASMHNNIAFMTPLARSLTALVAAWVSTSMSSGCNQVTDILRNTI